MSSDLVDVARARAHRIRHALDKWLSDLVDAKRAGDHTTLGYATWDEYLRGEFGTLPRLSRDERDAAVRLLQEAGMTQREIGATVGAGQTTVSARVRRAEHEQNGSGSATRTPLRGDMLTRRRAAVGELRTRGASTAQIAQALDISESQVKHDCSTLGIKVGSGAHLALPMDPAPIDWRSGPIESATSKLSTRHTEPLYRRSTTLQLCREMVGTFEADNAVARFAHDALDAQRVNDDQWFSEAAADLSSVYRYLDRLRAVLSDQSARERGAHDWRERDDLRSLRAVES